MDKQMPEMDGIGMSGRGKPPADSQLPVSVSMNPNDGDNPSIGSGVEAPSGADMRNKSGGNVSEDCPGMDGGC